MSKDRTLAARLGKAVGAKSSNVTRPGFGSHFTYEDGGDPENVTAYELGSGEAAGKVIVPCSGTKGMVPGMSKYGEYIPGTGEDITAVDISEEEDEVDSILDSIEASSPMRDALSSLTEEQDDLDIPEGMTMAEYAALDMGIAPRPLPTKAPVLSTVDITAPTKESTLESSMRAFIDTLAKAQITPTVEEEEEEEEEEDIPSVRYSLDTPNSGRMRGTAMAIEKDKNIITVIFDIDSEAIWCPPADQSVMELSYDNKTITVQYSGIEVTMKALDAIAQVYIATDDN